MTQHTINLKLQMQLKVFLMTGTIPAAGSAAEPQRHFSRKESSFVAEWAYLPLCVNYDPKLAKATQPINHMHLYFSTLKKFSTSGFYLPFWLLLKWSIELLFQPELVTFCTTVFTQRSFTQSEMEKMANLHILSEAHTWSHTCHQRVGYWLWIHLLPKYVTWYL